MQDFSAVPPIFCKKMKFLKFVKKLPASAFKNLIPIFQKRRTEIFFRTVYKFRQTRYDKEDEF